jgi:hypothetical protein
MAGIKSKVNSKQLEQFKKNLNKLNQNQVQQFSEAALRGLAARLLRAVRPRTPVGEPPERPIKELRTVKTKNVRGTGRTRSFASAADARWQQYWRGYTGGHLRRSWTVGEVRKVGDTYEIDVLNPVEYAPYVEFGHRQTPGRYVPALGKPLVKGWVNGKFMLTVSELELQADAPRILINKLKKFMGGAFNA